VLLAMVSSHLTGPREQQSTMHAVTSHDMIFMLISAKILSLISSVLNKGRTDRHAAT
jgi:hypothetical protein